MLLVSGGGTVAVQPPVAVLAAPPALTRRPQAMGHADPRGSAPAGARCRMVLGVCGRVWCSGQAGAGPTQVARALRRPIRPTR